MADPTILKEFPKEKKAGRPPEYPWDEWIDGETRRLKKGEHFTCEHKSLRALIHLTASKRNLRARTKIEGEDMIILFYKKKES